MYGEEKMADYYKPLTPAFRAQLNASIDKSRAEISTCKPNAYTALYNLGFSTLSTLINALPDGYPMPMKSESVCACNSMTKYEAYIKGKCAYCPMECVNKGWG